MKKESAKCEREAKKEEAKILGALRKKNAESAQVYASNAIRNKKQAQKLLVLSSKIDSVAAKVGNAVRMKSLTKSMVGVVQGLDSVIKSGDAAGIGRLMDKFEDEVESLDVMDSYMSDAIGGATADSTPATEVDALLQQVGEEHNLEVKHALSSAAMGIGEELPEKPAESAVAAGAGGTGVTDLEARLAALKDP